MRIGLISDTHVPEACAELWPQVFEAFDGVDGIIHAGDIYDLRILDQLHEVAPVLGARGNGDDGSGGRPVQPHDERLGDPHLVEIGGLWIGINHVMPIPEMPPHLTVAAALERLWPHRRPDVVVYGDTHVEHIATIDGILCVNPGSPTLPHNLNTQMGTIGFLDIDAGQAGATIWKIEPHGIEPFDWDTWGRPW
ncbi:MAG: YfcE family phosphodiesterase [Acidimicrobiia bacterium]|nr:YfcE family phosphodiesterase [Acidimicrobiia bacterium]